MSEETSVLKTEQTFRKQILVRISSQNRLVIAIFTSFFRVPCTATDFSIQIRTNFCCQVRTDFSFQVRTDLSFQVRTDISFQVRTDFSIHVRTDISIHDQTEL